MMDRATFERESARHRQVYEDIRKEIRRDCAGKYVVLAQGRLLTTADTFAEAQEAVQRLQPSQFFLIFPADMEPAFDLAYDL